MHEKSKLSSMVLDANMQPEGVSILVDANDPNKFSPSQRLKTI